MCIPFPGVANMQEFLFVFVLIFYVQAVNWWLIRTQTIVLAFADIMISTPEACSLSETWSSSNVNGAYAQRNFERHKYDKTNFLLQSLGLFLNTIMTVWKILIFHYLWPKITVKSIPWKYDRLLGYNIQITHIYMYRSKCSVYWLLLITKTGKSMTDRD